MKQIIFITILFSACLLYAQPFGNIAVFDGANDVIEAPDAFGSNFTDEVSIEAWINPCEVSGYRIIGSKFLCAGDNNAFFFSIFNGKLRWSWDDDACANGSNTFQSNNSIIQVNEWQHVAVVHDSLGVTLFLNGVPVSGSLTAGSVYGPIQVSNQPFRIGAYQVGISTYVGYYKGLIDEVRLWDTKRSSADILSDYNSPLTGAETDLVGYYKMNIINSGVGVTVPNSATVTGTSVDATTIGTLSSPIFETQNFSGISSILGNDTIICIGSGTLLLDATSANATYLWDNGSTSAIRTVSNGGVFSVKITIGCSEYFDTIDVGFSALPVVNLGSDTIICTNQSIILDASLLGATYLWQNGSTNATFNADQTNSYSVTVTKNGCSSTDQILVTVVGPANVDLGPDKSICQGTPAVLDVTNPLSTYLWSNGSTNPILTTSQNGVYFVEVNHLCGIKRDTVEVLVIPLPSVDLGNDTTLCTGQVLSINITEVGATYVWQDASTSATYSISQAGSYSVTLTKNGCSATDQIITTYITPAAVNLGPDQAICQGNAVTLDATSSFATYLWSNGSLNPIQSIFQTGTYSVVINHYCGIVKDTIEIIVNPIPVVDLGNDTTLCTGQALNIDVTEVGATYVWQDASTSATYSISQAGPYSVTLTKNGCSATDQIIATYITPAAVNLGPDQAICQGNAVTLDATSSSATYLWSNGSPNPIQSISQTGTYSVVINHYCGIVKDTIEIIVNPIPVVDLGNDTTLCTGQALNIDVTEVGATYVWQDASTSATYSISQAGTYSVILTKNGCSANDQIVVSYSALSVDLGNDIVLCKDEKTILNAQSIPSATYLWHDGSQSSEFLVSKPGIYSVTLTGEGCMVEDSIDVEYEILNNQIGFVSNPFCDYAELSLSSNPISNIGSAVTNIQWEIDDHKLNGTNVNTKLESEGLYQIKFSAISTACLMDTIFMIDVTTYSVPNSNFSISNYKPSIQEELVFRNFSEETDRFVWGFGNGDISEEFEPEYFYNESGTYEINLTVKNENCESTSSQIVKVEKELTYYIPNAFTPDGNQFNEKFMPVFTSGYNPYNYELKIFNRLGELVFISYNANLGWNGLYNGLPAESGTYIWQVLFGEENGSGRIIDKGTVSLFR